MKRNDNKFHAATELRRMTGSRKRPDSSDQIISLDCIFIDPFIISPCSRLDNAALLMMRACGRGERVHLVYS